MAQLLRRIHHRMAKTMTPAEIFEQYPADIYTYGHYSWHEIPRLLPGRLVFSCNMLTSKENFVNGTWKNHFWQKHLVHVCNDADAWVKKNGEYVSGRWEPGRIVDLGQLTNEHINYLITQMGEWHDDYWMDMCFSTLPYWVLPDGVGLTDLDGYVPMKYTLQMQKLISGMKDRGILGWVNGDRDLAYQGFPVMYENVDTQHQDKMWKHIAQWLAPVCEGSVLSVETSIATTWDVLNVWSRTDKILECMNSDVAKVAWEMSR